MAYVIQQSESRDISAPSFMLVACLAQCLTLKMEATFSSETLVDFQILKIIPVINKKVLLTSLKVNTRPFPLLYAVLLLVV
jgi:hypothetical protein